jgi:hypothetical protein
MERLSKEKAKMPDARTKKRPAAKKQRIPRLDEFKSFAWGAPRRDDGLVDERFLSEKEADALWDPDFLFEGEAWTWRPAMIGDRPMHECTPQQLEAELNIMRGLYKGLGKLSDAQMARVRLIKHFQTKE